MIYKLTQPYPTLQLANRRTSVRRRWILQAIIRQHRELFDYNLPSATCHLPSTIYHPTQINMPNNSMVLSLLSQYELLEWIARHLSTIDLFYLSLTCSEVYQIVRQSETVFQRLKRLSLCDGRGLKARQEFKGLQRPYYFYDEGKGYRANYDEEIEVRVWNLKCDATNALPCSKCGINVCEVCRLPLA